MTGPKPISAVDAIHLAFQHAKQQLLQPFRFAQWARLALVGLLAGEMGSSSGYHSDFDPASMHHRWGPVQFLSAVSPPQFAHHPTMPAGMIAFLVVFGFGLLVFFIYLNSVMRFILFDSVVAKQCLIRQGWIRRRRHGLRLFVWQILLTLATMSAFLVVIGIPVAHAWANGWFAHPRQHLLPLVLGGAVLFSVLVVVLAVSAVIHVMTKDFVVPQMALENISAIEGWQRLWLWLKAEKGSYAGYIGMKIALAIGASIILGIVAVIVLVLLLVPVGGIGISAVLAGKAAGLTWNLYTIWLAAVVGCLGLVVFVFAISLISVPGIVFFPAYSIYFLAPRYSPLASLLAPGPVAPAAETREPL
jgi:hypothetical protein